MCVARAPSFMNIYSVSSFTHTHTLFLHSLSLSIHLLLLLLSLSFNVANPCLEIDRRPPPPFVVKESLRRTAAGFLGFQNGRRLFISTHLVHPLRIAVDCSFNHTFDSLSLLGSLYKAPPPYT